MRFRILVACSFIMGLTLACKNKSEDASLSAASVLNQDGSSVAIIAPFFMTPNPSNSQELRTEGCVYAVSLTAGETASLRNAEHVSDIDLYVAYRNRLSSLHNYALNVDQILQRANSIDPRGAFDPSSSGPKDFNRYILLLSTLFEASHDMLGVVDINTADWHFLQDQLAAEANVGLPCATAGAVSDGMLVADEGDQFDATSAGLSLAGGRILTRLGGKALRRAVKAATNRTFRRRAARVVTKAAKKGVVEKVKGLPKQVACVALGSSCAESAGKACIGGLAATTALGCSTALETGLIKQGIGAVKSATGGGNPSANAGSGSSQVSRGSTGVSLSPFQTCIANQGGKACYAKHGVTPPQQVVKQIPPKSDFEICRANNGGDACYAKHGVQKPTGSSAGSIGGAPATAEELFKVCVSYNGGPNSCAQKHDIVGNELISKLTSDACAEFGNIRDIKDCTQKPSNESREILREL